jgi:cytochrome c-type biogenesis protein CcmF
MLRFIWLGTLVMAFGGLLAATDRRYRLVTREARSTAGTQPAAESV